MKNWLLIPGLLFLAGCTHYIPCGSFGFAAQPSPPSQFAPTPVPVAIDFTFDPGRCSPSLPACQCDRIAWLQIIRISDPAAYPPASAVNPPPYKARFSIFPDGEYFTRQTVNGWSLDITAGRKLGYYGLQDDGTPVTSTIVVFGRNGVTARLHDTPSFSATVVGPNLPGAAPHDTRFEAVSVPVCTAGDVVCNNKLFGYIGWLIRANKQNAITESGALPTDSDFGAVVREAIVAWNDHVNDGQKTPLPLFTPLR